MKKSSNYIKLEFLSGSTNEGFARSAVAAFASQLDPTLDELSDIKTAVSEAVTNAIVHAYPDTLGKIVVRVRLLDGGVLEIAVYDWGRGIADVEKAREPLFTTGGEERSGMGFTIMESFMDTLKVRSRPGTSPLCAASSRAKVSAVLMRGLCAARSFCAWSPRDDGAIKVSRTLRERSQSIYSAREKLRVQLGREPVLSEIAARRESCSIRLSSGLSVPRSVSSVRPSPISC